MTSRGDRQSEEEQAGGTIPENPRTACLKVSDVAEGGLIWMLLVKVSEVTPNTLGVPLVLTAEESWSVAFRRETLAWV